MTTITFDTHKIVTQLKQAGLPEPQAEAITRAFQDVTAEAEVATRSDVEAVQRDIEEVRRDIRTVELTLRGDIRTVELALRSEMREMELRLTVKLGAMLALAIGIVAAMVKLL